ncbi:GGDEF domain-containing protein [Niveibacterium sp.]|uniref:GGDEF domain-containing protein n=1 Tax=Niveibacterium sp. TaxID=2017444 RepID=UPI0035B25BE3
MSSIDILTKTGSRSALSAELDRALRSARSEAPGFALVLADVTNFKRFNTHNPAALGDIVLIRLAECLKAVMGTRGRVYRVHGGMFGVILRGAGEAEAIAICTEILRATHNRITPPQAVHCGHHLCSGPVTVGVACGFALASPEHNTETLMREADMNLYEAKTAATERTAMPQASRPAE